MMFPIAPAEGARRAGLGAAWTRATWIAPLALALACVPQNAGYEDVRNVVSRTGQDVRWQRHEPKRPAAAEARALLAAPLTADSAVKLALLNNAELQASFEQLGMARGELIRALRLPNPALEGGLKYEEEGSPGVELSLSQDITELIFLPLRSGAARAEFAAATLEVAGRAMDLILEVRRAFYGYLADQQILELRLTALEALAASAKAAEEIHAAGNMTDLDLETHRVLYEEAKVSSSSAETALATSRERLNVLLGLWGTDVSWRATGRLEHPEDARSDALGAEALARSVELAAIRQRFAAAAKRASLERARGLLPEIKAGVSFEREGSEWGYGPIAEIELPIFYQGQGEVARAEAEMRREQQLYAATGVRIRAALRAVLARASTARDRAMYLHNVLLPMRERILEQTQLQFNAMNASVFQLLVARRDQIEAGRAYVESLREYWVARADLEQFRAGRLPEGAMAGPSSSLVTVGTSEPAGH